MVGSQYLSRNHKLRIALESPGGVITETVAVDSCSLRRDELEYGAFGILASNSGDAV